jgi:hypothetical protein
MSRPMPPKPSNDWMATFKPDPNAKDVAPEPETGGGKWKAKRKAAKMTKAQNAAAAHARRKAMMGF